MAIINGKIHYKWPFSIATLNYQRVNMVIFHFAVVNSTTVPHLGAGSFLGFHRHVLPHRQRCSARIRQGHPQRALQILVAEEEWNFTQFMDDDPIPSGYVKIAIEHDLSIGKWGFHGSYSWFNIAIEHGSTNTYFYGTIMKYNLSHRSYFIPFISVSWAITVHGWWSHTLWLCQNSYWTWPSRNSWFTH